MSAPPPVSFFSGEKISGQELPATESQPVTVAAVSDPQALLFPDLPIEVMERVLKQEGEGRWTGERLAAEDPGLYRAICRMIAADIPVQSIQYLCAVSDHTVRGIREREPVFIADQ